MKIFKRILLGLLAFVGFSLLLLIMPRLWSAINNDKAPVGYHFTIPTYLAIGIGIEKLINKDPELPSTVEEIKNIEYKSINGKSLQLDIYKPKNLKERAPLLLFIHGGGWKSGNRADYKVYLVAYAKKGYITATASYRFVADAPYPACAEDISDAVNWLFENADKYGYDPDRIALIGGSAGAHLALLTAYGWKNKKDPAAASSIQHRVKAVVDIYGPVDFTTEYARTQPLITSFLAHSYADKPALYMDASPINYVSKNVPPTMILHGTSDDLVPISQSDSLKSRLDKYGVPNVYYKVPLWPHTMDLVQRVNDFAQLKMDSFFEKYLK